MTRRFLITLIFLTICHVADAQGDPITDADDAAIRNAIQSYAEAFNSGDAAAVAEHWSEAGEFITPGGSQLKGRDAIRAEFEAFFAESKGAKVEIGDPHIEFLSPNVASEHGTATVIRPDGEPQATDYVAIHVKSGGKWKMDRVEEAESSAGAVHDNPLDELGWMIGEWVDADDAGIVETRCEWTKNGHYILRSFRVSVKDRIELEGTQVIGWDPVRQTIRSWVFDSDGGFGVGLWTENDDQWTVRSLHVTRDGAQASAINIMTKVDGNTFKFKSVGREADGELLPNIYEVTVVRKK